ncbi:MAG TPA: hypothetical protein VGJ00_07835 [Rhabdochlamydiaceae bacterium]|jgi:hypothetical protein
MSTPAVSPEPVKQEFNWKRLFIKAAGFGAGFGLMFVLCALSINWYESRPKPPKPWDGSAITAEYRNLNAEEDQKIQLLYTLSNNTNYDFRIEESDKAEIGMKLDSPDTYAEFNQYTKIDLPIFIPAHKKTIAILHFQQSYPIKFKANGTEDERTKYRRDIEEFLKKKEVLTGFVLLHEPTRYRIDFPPGWNKDSAKK